MSHEKEQYSKAEDLFTSAWGETEVFDRNFEGMPTAEEIYGGTKVSAVEHVKVPERVDSNGDPYIYHNVLLKLMADLYAQDLMTDNIDLDERFDQAIHYAHHSQIDSNGVDVRISGGETEREVNRDGHAYILNKTKNKILQG